MARILPGVILLALFALVCFADEPAALPFKYNISVNDRSVWTRHHFFGVPVEFKLLDFAGESLERVPGTAASPLIYVSVSSTYHGIVAVAKEGDSFVGKPIYPLDKPAKRFRFQIESIQLSPEGQASIELRFKGNTEIYRLRYAEGEGLHFESVDAKFGKVTAGTVPDFVNLKETEGPYVYQCNPLSTSATKDGKPFWSNDIPMQGQPAALFVMDLLLFVRTTSAHSFYVMKDSGELVFYDRSEMAGENPSEEILTIWRNEIRRAPYDLTRRGYYRFIRAVGMLDEKRAIPLLIESIEIGRSLEERCAAIAVLEKFNGNPGVWSSESRLPRSYYLKKIGMNRVFPKEARKAEREKWEKVFKDYLEK